MTRFTKPNRLQLFGLTTGDGEWVANIGIRKHEQALTAFDTIGVGTNRLISLTNGSRFRACAGSFGTEGSLAD
jgi:hypothetical protein